VTGYDLQTARIVSVYHTETSSWAMPRPTARSHSGLVYFEAGSIRYHFGDGDQTAGSGDVLVFPKGLTYFGEKQTETNRFIVIDFEAEPEEGLDMLNLPRIMSMGESGGRLFRQAVEAWSSGKMHVALQCRSILYAILAELVDLNARGRRQSALMEQALIYLSQHYTDPELSVEAVGREFHISASQLRRLFRQELGISPGQYIIRLRLELAQNLLRHECLSVREVTMRTGFSSEFYFSRLFRKKFGVPPSSIKG